MKEFKETKVNKFVRWTMVGSLAVIGLGLITFLYWLNQPSDVLHVKEQPVPVRTIREHPTAAGVVILHFDYCKQMEATGRVRVSFVSASREVFLPVAEDKQPPQCQDIEVPVLIPNDLPPDKYRIHYRVEYRINPIRTVIEEIDSKEFKVVL